MSYFDTVQENPRFSALSPEQQRTALSLALDQDLRANPRFESVDPQALAQVKEQYLDDFFIPERGVFGDIGSRFTRGVVGAVGLAGGGLAEFAPEGTKGQETGEELYQWSKEKLRESPFLQPDLSERRGEESFLYRGIMGGIESLPGSLAPFVIGGAGTLAGGPVVGIGAGTATLLGTFGLGTYHQSKDEAQQFLAQNRPELSPEEIEKLAKRKALKDATFEAGTELVGDALALMSFGGSKIIEQPLAATIKELIFSPKALAKEFAKDALFETASEAVAAVGQAKAAEEIGMPTMGATEAAVESIIPSLFMSLVFGGSIHGANRLQARQTLLSLNSENAEVRKATVERVAENINDADARETWVSLANDRIAANKPIEVNTVLADMAAQKANEETTQAEFQTQALGELYSDLADKRLTPDQVRANIERFTSAGIQPEAVGQVLSDFEAAQAPVMEDILAADSVDEAIDLANKSLKTPEPYGVPLKPEGLPAFARREIEAPVAPPAQYAFTPKESVPFQRQSTQRQQELQALEQEPLPNLMQRLTETLQQEAQAPKMPVREQQPAQPTERPDAKNIMAREYTSLPEVKRTFDTAKKLGILSDIHRIEPLDNGNWAIRQTAPEAEQIPAWLRDEPKVQQAIRDRAKAFGIPENMIDEFGTEELKTFLKERPRSPLLQKEKVTSEFKEFLLSQQAPEWLRNEADVAQAAREKARAFGVPDELINESTTAELKSFMRERPRSDLPNLKNIQPELRQFIPSPNDLAYMESGTQILTPEGERTGQRLPSTSPDWFQSQPGNLTTTEAREALRKAYDGEELSAREERFINHAAEAVKGQWENTPQVIGGDELQPGDTVEINGELNKVTGYEGTDVVIKNGTTKKISSFGGELAIDRGSHMRGAEPVAEGMMESDKTDETGIPGPIERGQEAGRAVQEPGAGGEAVEAGGIFQTPGQEEIAPESILPVSPEPVAKTVAPAFDEMVKEAARWKGATQLAAQAAGQDKKSQLAIMRQTTKADLDSYLMKKFGIDETTARDVSNTLTRENIPADMSATLSNFEAEPWAKAAVPNVRVAESRPASQKVAEGPTPKYGENAKADLEIVKKIRTDLLNTSNREKLEKLMDEARKISKAWGVKNAHGASDTFYNFLEAKISKPIAKPQSKTALSEIDKAKEKGTIDEGAHALLTHLLTNVAPDFDQTASIKILKEARKVTPKQARAAGYEVKKGAKYAAAGSTAVEHQDSLARAAIRLYAGHDADTVVEEFMHTDWLHLSDAERAEYQRYHDRSGDTRPVQEHYAQEARDDFFSEKRHEAAGGIRGLFQRAREALFNLLGRIRKHRELSIPENIKELYKRAGEQWETGKKVKPEAEAFQIKKVGEDLIADTPESQTILDKLDKMKTKKGLSELRVGRAMEKYESVIKTLRDDKVDIFEKQKTLEEHIKATLPRQEQFRLLPEIKKISKPKTEAGRAAMLDRAIAKVEAVHQVIERKTALKTLDSMLKKGPVRTKKGLPSNKRLTAEANQLVDMAKKYRNMSAEEATDAILKLAAIEDTGIENGGRELTEEEINERVMAQLFANLEGRPTADIEHAIAQLDKITKEGKAAWLDAEAKRKAEWGARREELYKLITGGKKFRGQFEENFATQMKGVFEKTGEILSAVENAHISFEMLMDKLVSSDKTAKPLEHPLAEHYARMVYDATMAERNNLKARSQSLNNAIRKIYGKDAAREIVENSKIKEKTGVTIRTSGRWEAKTGVDPATGTRGFQATDGENTFFFTDKEEARAFAIKANQNALKKARTEIPLSQDIAADIWMHFQQPTLADDLDRQGVDDTTYSELMKFLKPKTLELAQWHLDDYEANWGSLNEVHKARYYVNMAKILGYSSTKRRFAGETVDDAMLRNTPMHASIVPSALHVRVKNQRELLFRPIYQKWMQHVAETEHFKAWAMPMWEMRSVLGAENIQTAIKQAKGGSTLKALTRFIDDFARGGVDRSKSIYILDRLRANFALSKTALNPRVFIKQLTSIPMYAAEIPAKDFAAGTAYAMAHPKEVYDILMQSEEMKHRGEFGQERDIALALKGFKTTQKINKYSIQSVLALPSILGDRFAIVVGGWSVYDYHYKKNIAKGMNPAKAKKEALYQFDRATLRSQQSPHIMDMGWIQRQGSIANLFTNFITSPLDYTRNSFLAIQNLAMGRGNKAANIKRLILSWVVANALYQFVSSGFDPDKEELAASVLTGPLNGLVFMRELNAGLMAALFQGKVYQQSQYAAPFSTATQVFHSGYELNKLLTEGYDEKRLKSMLDDWAEIAASVSGVPYTAPKRTLEGLIEAAKGETEFPFRRLLGFREEMLKEKTK